MRAASLGLAVLLAGCGARNPPDPCADGHCPDPTYAVCPRGLQPRFSELRGKVFAPSCAVSGCHAGPSAVDSGNLDLAQDAYAHLVGVPSANVGALDPDAPHPLRVAPGQPDGSMLLIKLGLKATADKRYGHGMPYPTPGDVCPDTLDAIRQWIAQGAPNN